jgi:triacylglycerol esterase/lipase EstA (alpha/beta hydrolase family)
MKRLLVVGSGTVGGLVLLAALQAAPPVLGSRSAQSSPAVLEKPEARLVQVSPISQEADKLARSRGQKRAVVLIHGYWVHFRKDNVKKALLRDWQEPKSLLVNTLAPESDIYAFAYGQTVPLDGIVALPALHEGITSLKRLGYAQIVLVGHSAGGLIARHFVEDNPRAGVTKVIQVSAPNGGTSVADFKWVPKAQKPFLASLSTAGRLQCLAQRTSKKVPDAIQFVCVVTLEDTLVPVQSQWSKDLQEQGIPVVRWPTGHGQIVRKSRPAHKIAEVIREPQPRWKADQVAVVAADIGRARKAK